MIIGLLGQAGAGKDTIADILVKDHNFVKVALADPLKRIARDVFAFTDEQLWGPSEKRNAPDLRYPRGMREGDQCLTPRFALQQLGTEWGRNCYPNVWVDYALRVAKQVLRNDYAKGELMELYTAMSGLYKSSFGFGKVVEWEMPKGVVISDVRFRNEVDAIRAAGGMVWKIKRDKAGLGGAAGAHASETEQLSIPEELFRVVLDNNGTLDDLGFQVDVALEGVR